MEPYAFWQQLKKEFPECRHQRYWVQKRANILDNLPQAAFLFNCELKFSKNLRRIAWKISDLGLI